MEQLIAAYPQVEVSISTSAKHLRSVGEWRVTPG
jgi:hypothetical protein